MAAAVRAAGVVNAPDRRHQSAGRRDVARFDEGFRPEAHDRATSATNSPRAPRTSPSTRRRLDALGRRPAKGARATGRALCRTKRKRADELAGQASNLKDLIAREWTGRRTPRRCRQGRGRRGRKPRRRARRRPRAPQTRHAFPRSSRAGWRCRSPARWRRILAIPTVLAARKKASRSLRRRAPPSRPRRRLGRLSPAPTDRTDNS